MNCKTRRGRFAPSALLATALVPVAMVLTACGGSASSSSSAPANAASGPIACGLGNGKQATGTPIKIGAIGTKVPGLDFTAAPLAAAAYFGCVNHNGGINGRPVDYILSNDALIPSGTAAVAAKLIESDNVAAMVGSASINECNLAPYLASHGITADIDMALPQNCYETNNLGPVNSSTNTALGLAGVMAAHGAKKMVVVINQGPGVEASITAPFQYWGQQKGIPTKVLIVPAPIANPSALAVQVAQAAGGNGGVVLSFDPTDEVAIMKAVQQQNLVGSDQWGSSSQSATDSIARSLGSFWDNKFLIADEFALPSSAAASTYRAVEAKYGGGAELSAIGENGFVAAQIATAALLKLPSSQLTRSGINAAFRNINNYKSAMVCTPYFFGNLQFHMSNYAVGTVTPHNNVLVSKYGCSEIPATPANHVAEIKAYAQAHGDG
jgi:branched-chain amino acid transport system substrate-binding protein